MKACRYQYCLPFNVCVDKGITILPTFFILTAFKFLYKFEGIQPEQQPLYSMTGPCLITGILEINNSMHFRRRQKHILQMTNMRI